MTQSISRFTFLTALFAAIISLVGCGGMTMPGSDSKVAVMVDDSVNTSEGRIIVLPIILAANGNFAAANNEFDNEALNAVLLDSWSSRLENGETYVVPKSAIDNIPNGWDAMELLIRAMDESREVRSDSETLQNFFKKINEMAGKGAVAIGLVFQNEETYQATKTLKYNAGLYDTESAKFKWITNAAEKQAVQIPYQVALQQIVESSWTALEEKTDGQVR